MVQDSRGNACHFEPVQVVDSTGENASFQCNCALFIGRQRHNLMQRFTDPKEVLRLM